MLASPELSEKKYSSEEQYNTPDTISRNLSTKVLEICNFKEESVKLHASTDSQADSHERLADIDICGSPNQLHNFQKFDFEEKSKGKFPNNFRK